MPHNDNNNNVSVQVELDETRYQVQYGGQPYTNKMHQGKSKE